MELELLNMLMISNYYILYYNIKSLRLRKEKKYVAVVDQIFEKHF